MIIRRYLAKEVFLTLLALMLIILLIFFSNQFMSYLGRAVRGHIPAVFIAKLMLLELPTLLTLLLPLGLFLAFLLAYGRLYADSEMVVLKASGFGARALLKLSLACCAPVFVLTLAMMLWLSPLIYQERGTLLHDAGLSTLVQTLSSGEFRSMSQGRDVVYLAHINKGQKEAEGVFMARLDKEHSRNKWLLTLAKKARLVEEADKSSYVLLEDGQTLDAEIGLSELKKIDFGQAQIKLPPKKNIATDDVRALPTSALLPYINPDREKAAELQWRFAVPIMALVLTLIAVPLAKTNPRSGRFHSIVPAIGIFFLYAQGLFLCRNKILQGSIPIELGFWPVHLGMLLLALALWRYRGDRFA